MLLDCMRSMFGVCMILYNVLFCVVYVTCCLGYVWGLMFLRDAWCMFDVVCIMFSVVLLMFRNIFSSFPQPVENFLFVVENLLKTPGYLLKTCWKLVENLVWLLKTFVETVETVETVENLSLNIKCCNLKIAGIVSRETMAHKKIASWYKYYLWRMQGFSGCLRRLKVGYV